MKIQIWSDVVCPFCYIGKIHFEQALGRASKSKNVEIEWKSFQLDPHISSKDPKVNSYEYLANKKGISIEQSKELHQNVTIMSKHAGLEYNFDVTVIANSFEAHRLIQLAKTKGVGNKVFEALFAAHFTHGEDISDLATLLRIGSACGLDALEINDALTSDSFAYEVQKDIQEAQNLGIHGVPFFLIDGKYAISGAQPTEVFVDVLNQIENQKEG